jgi:3-ketosteroid 9alpha-monooxygenase subunit A
MVERFEIEVDTTRANEYWNVEVEENLKAQEVSNDIPAEQR